MICIDFFAWVYRLRRISVCRKKRSARCEAPLVNERKINVYVGSCSFSMVGCWLAGWLTDWNNTHTPPPRASYDVTEHATNFAQWALWPRNPLCFVCDESTRRPWDALLTLLVGLELTGWFRVSVSRRFAVQPVELTCSIQYWILMFFFSKWCIS